MSRRIQYRWLAAFIKTDTTTAGSWKGVYGADGFNVISDTVNYPSYVTVTSSGLPHAWTTSTTDTRALQKASSSDRIASSWYSWGTFTIDLRFTDNAMHQVALYLLDWDNYYGRIERVDILDANNAVLDTRTVSNFVGGQYLVWNLSGHVTIRVVNRNASSYAVVSGLFFGGAAAGTPFTPIRIHCGGPQITDASGNVWSPDNAQNRNVTNAAIANTSTPALYQTEAWSNSTLQYQFTAPNGPLTVKLHFAEFYRTQAGQRTFNIVINGTTYFSNFDILAVAPTNTAYDLSIPVTVGNGLITIQLVPVLGPAKVDAIEIF